MTCILKSLSAKDVMASCRPTSILPQNARLRDSRISHSQVFLLSTHFHVASGSVLMGQRFH